MKIATWNLNSCNALTADRDRLFHEVMDPLDADVWVLTETWTNFALAHPYRLVTQSCPANDLRIAGRAADRRWVAIWSRLEARQLEILDDPERMACVRVEQPGQGDLVVVGTVLPWRTDSRHPRQTWAEAFPRQAEEWRCLWGKPPANGFCVAGDFNQEMMPPHHTGSEANCSTMAVTLAGLGLTCLTENILMLYPTPLLQKPLPIIDHICVGGGLRLRPETAAVTWTVPPFGGGHLTDHVGVLADLVVPEPNSTDEKN